MVCFLCLHTCSTHHVCRMRLPGLALSTDSLDLFPDCPRLPGTTLSSHQCADSNVFRVQHMKLRSLITCCCQVHPTRSTWARLPPQAFCSVRSYVRQRTAFLIFYYYHFRRWTGHSINVNNDKLPAQRQSDHIMTVITSWWWWSRHAE